MVVSSVVTLGGTSGVNIPYALHSISGTVLLAGKDLVVMKNKPC